LKTGTSFSFRASVHVRHCVTYVQLSEMTTVQGKSNAIPAHAWTQRLRWSSG
jgi:hypothetical protein